MDPFDVVIIGSGYGGSITAARLAEAGMAVLLLERGPRMETADLRQTDDPKYIQQVIDLVVTSGNVAFRTGNMVGGASIPMDGAHFRMPEKSYTPTDDSGRPYWPAELSKASLAPYFDAVEEMMSIRQFPWTEIPKAGGMFAMMLDRVGASCDRARLNYTDCLQCGFCSTGCIYDKKRTMLHTYIPLAEANGAEVRANCDVRTVTPGGQGYIVSYLRDGVLEEVSAVRVIVAAGGIHSPAVLLRSASNLPDLSPHVGENFNNNGEHAFVGILPPDFADLDAFHCYKGMDNAGLMSWHWFDDEGFTLHPGAGLEPTVFAAALAAADHPVLPSRAWGMEYKRFVEEVYPHRVIGFSALGLADGHRAVTLDNDGNPDLEDRPSPAHDAYLDRLESIVLDIGDQTGVALMPSVPRKLSGTTSAHLLSACRIAETPEDGVVDVDCQVHNYENLYVCDASSVPYSLGVNPALTISALAERTAARILEVG